MIRRVREADIGGLCEIEARCFSGDAHKVSRRSMRYLAKSPRARLYVDEREGVLSGYILILSHRRHRHDRVYSLAVLPEFRKRGIAEALLDVAEGDCDKGGIVLEVREDNVAALTLYKKRGYRIQKRKLDYYGVGQHALCLLKEYERSQPHCGR